MIGHSEHSLGTCYLEPADQTSRKSHKSSTMSHWLQQPNCLGQDYSSVLSKCRCTNVIICETRDQLFIIWRRRGISPLFICHSVLHAPQPKSKQTALATEDFATISEARGYKMSQGTVDLFKQLQCSQNSFLSPVCAIMGGRRIYSMACHEFVFNEGDYCSDLLLA